MLCICSASLKRRCWLLSGRFLFLPCFSIRIDWRDEPQSSILNPRTELKLVLKVSISRCEVRSRPFMFSLTVYGVVYLPFLQNTRIELFEDDVLLFCHLFLQRCSVFETGKHVNRIIACCQSSHETLRRSLIQLLEGLIWMARLENCNVISWTNLMLRNNGIAMPLTLNGHCPFIFRSSILNGCVHFWVDARCITYIFLGFRFTFDCSPYCNNLLEVTVSKYCEETASKLSFSSSVYFPFQDHTLKCKLRSKNL